MPESQPSFGSTRLAGDGFVLRPWCEADLESLLLHANDSEVSRGLSHRFPYPYLRTDADDFLAGRVIDLRNPVLAIEVDGAACGGIGAHPGMGERSIGAEMGYWLGRRLWGQGIMTRAVARFVPFAMEGLDLQRIQATVLDFNIGSARVLEKNGFVQEGIMRRAVRKHCVTYDLRLFARLREPTLSRSAGINRDAS